MARQGKLTTVDKILPQLQKKLQGHLHALSASLAPGKLLIWADDWPLDVPESAAKSA